MSEKILTISVAAYNMESYIRENLESMLKIEDSQRLEIFVVDDGGKDSTYSIAKEYESKYPGIVFAIHKTNGGYGSVQNYSIAHATGKYFKILDGDDWMDTDGLEKLVSFLKTTDIDAVITNYYKGPDKENLTLCKLAQGNNCSTTINPNMLMTAIGMWALVYKTEILKKSGMILPEHTLYTDRIYSTIPFTYVDQIALLDFPVYCYRIGRNGQSVSRESRIKHINEYLYVTEIICKHYTGDKRKHKEYMLLKSSAAYKVSVRALLLLPSTKENLNKLKEYEKKIKNIAPDVFKKAASLKTRMGWIITYLRLTRYSGYWLLGKIPKTLIDF